MTKHLTKSRQILEFVEYSEEAERIIEPQAVKPDWLNSITRLGAASLRRSFATTIQEPIS